MESLERDAQSIKRIVSGGVRIDDLDKYMEKFKKPAPRFAVNFDDGFEEFKICAVPKITFEN
jgi:hypothetical protein